MTGLKSLLGAFAFIVATIAATVWIFSATPGIGKPIDVDPLLASSAPPDDALSH